MKPNYKNWMPKGMIWSAAAGCAVCLALALLFGLTTLTSGTWKTVLTILFAVGAAVCVVATVWMTLMYHAFSYDGKRQMSRQIIDGVAAKVVLPDGGCGLDIGCGSGALTIAVAKRNPKARMTGIDRWGAEYSSFGLFMSRGEATWMGLKGSAILMGKK